MAKGLVIIGSGLAGYNLAKEWRKLDSETPLTIITEEPSWFYSKPQLSTGYGQNKLPEQLVITPGEAMAKQLKADILAETKVERIDTNAKQCIAGGQVIEYDQLVLCVGAKPIEPRLDGDGVSQVVSVNNLSDYYQVRQQLEGARQKVIVLGTGLVGCEFANDWSQAGHDIQMVSMDECPLSKLVPERVGQQLANVFSDAGIKSHFSSTAKRVDLIEDQLVVSLENGEQLLGDIVLSAIGLRSNIDLAKSIGLDVDQGVVVDDYLQTSDPHIFALGDCAQVFGQVRMYVPPILTGARALAKTLVGDRTAVMYPIMPVGVKTTMYPIVVYRPYNVKGDWQFSEELGYTKGLFYNLAGDLAGFVLTGDLIKQKMECVKKLSST